MKYRSSSITRIARVCTYFGPLAEDEREEIDIYQYTTPGYLLTHTEFVKMNQKYHNNSEWQVATSGRGKEKEVLLPEEF